MKRSIGKTMIVGFGLAFSVLIAVGLLQYATTRQLVEAGRWVAHTDEALSAIQTVLADVKDAESWLRGYAATGDQMFLAPYLAAITRTPNHLQELRQLTLDNPRQQHRLDILGTLVARRFQHLGKVMELRREGGLSAAADFMEQGQGLSLMDEIVRVTSDMAKEERDLLRERTAAVEASKLRTDTAILVGSLLAIGLLLGSAVVVHNDMVERKLAEAALQANEERYRALVTATSQIVWTTNALGAVAADMPSWRAFTGQSQQEIVGWGWADALHPKDRQRTVDLWSKAVRDRSLYETEYRIRRHDGEYRYVSVRGVPVREPDGSIREWVGTCTDITNAHLAREAVRRASAYNRSLLEASLDPLVTISPEGRITDVNNATEKVTGYSRNELIGTDFSDYFTDPERARAGYQQAFREGSVQDYELEVRHRDGHNTPVVYNASVYTDENGKVMGVFAAARDITERKRGEDALRESQALTNAIVDSTSDLIWSVDPESFSLLTFNRGLQDYFLHGRGIRLQTGMRPEDLLPNQEFADRWRGFYQRALSEGPYTTEYEAVGSNILQLTLNLLKRDGKVFGISVFGKDITERKRAEQRLRDSEERYRTLFDSIDEGFCTIEMLFDENNKPTDYRFLEVNPSFEKQTGIQNARGRRMREIAPLHEEHWFEIYGKIALTGEPARFENPAAQLHRWYDVYAFRVGEPRQKNVAILFNDITERKRAEAALQESIDDLKRAEVELRRLNRALQALTECSEAMVRASEEPDLLERVCRLLVEVGGYRLVWVGYAEQDEAKSVRPVAHAGVDEGYLAGVNITWADDERGRGPTGTAIRTGQPCAARNYQEDPMVARWRAEATQRGYASSIALPLMVDGQTFGALTLYSQTVNAFDGAEVSLLEDLATDLAFGIHILRARTERKRAMETLEVQAAQLTEQAMLLDLAPAAIFVRDMQSRIIYWNRGAEEIYGWSQAEALGNVSHQLLRTQFPKPLLDIEAETLHVGLWEGELRSTKRDGEQIVVASRWASHRDRQGNLVGLLEVNLDNTERKRAEAEIQRLNENLERRVLERTAELEAANSELKAFTYSVAHDLRAPLRHMAGFAKLLEEEYSAKLDDTAQHYLDRIRTGTLNMGRLLDDLLTLSRIGRLELTSKLTGLGSLVKEVVNELESDTSGRRIEWKVGELPCVECDPALMKLVFQNLLANACKFTRPREVAIIEVGQAVVNGQPSIFVRDNGVGFNMKYVDKLFGVFQRLHRQTDFEGTGVGLATVQRIIQKHGGRAWAEGEVNKGATFFFTFPAMRTRVEGSVAVC